jgi:hypothetical protein
VEVRAVDLPPQVGMRVVTMDAKIIGQVEDVGTGGFRVQQGEDHAWISLEAVYLVEHGSVRLLCNADGLARYILQHGDGVA